MELAIDIRETFLKTVFPNAVHKALDIGDITVSSNGIPFLVFERKTIKDYVASIKDGRLHEQKARLLEWRSQASCNKVLYIIEGWTEFPMVGASYMLQGVSVQAIVTSVINAMIRDNIHVIFTSDEADTARCIEHIYARCQKNEDLYTKPVSTEYIETVKLKKNKNITSDNVFILQLCQIPGVSLKIAQALYEAHPTMAHFVKHVSGFEPDRQHGYIANMQFETSTGKRRRIGDKAAETILTYTGLK
jgi:ERCC4-type nuclease